jgi:protein tyrosine phosphatase (PTP) superfamily phosphohydrolase (DUF442 family)
MKRFKRLAYPAFLFALLMACSAHSTPVKTGRSPFWAEPLKVEGLPNLHKVSDRLYRSAQPEKEGMAGLKSLGIKTVVSLRANHSDETMLKGTGCAYRSIPIDTWNLKEKQVVEFLKIVSDPSNAPVLVHCQHGADRTGTMCAVYRIVFDGWTKEQAILEMKEGGYGFHSVWAHIPKWIQKLDIESVKAQAGIKDRPVPDKTASGTQTSRKKILAITD